MQPLAGPLVVGHPSSTLELIISSSRPAHLVDLLVRFIAFPFELMVPCCMLAPLLQGEQPDRQHGGQGDEQVVQGVGGRLSTLPALRD